MISNKSFSKAHQTPRTTQVRRTVWNSNDNGGLATTAHHFDRFPVFNTTRLLVQPKLEINAPGDKYEQEADHMAEQLMAMHQPLIQRKFSSCGKEEDEEIRTKSRGQSPSFADANLTSKIEQTRGRGVPMNTNTRNFMEGCFGTDFSQIRIHADSNAAQMNNQINARAFTVGNDIYFNSGQHETTSIEGKKLLAHELTHTLQQESNFFIRRSPQDWFQGNPDIGQWSVTQIQNEIEELEEWLGRQTESSEDTARIEDSLGLLRTELQGRENLSTDSPRESRRPSPTETEDWQAMADRLTTTELENEILNLRSHVSSMTESIADDDDFTDQLRIYEDNLLRRQEILNTGRRTTAMARQLTREQIEQGGGSAALALANLNEQAKGAFGVAFFSSFLAELPPGDLQDANEDLRRNPLQFQGGYLIGLPIGVWHGLTGLLQGLWGLVQFVGNFTPSAIASRIGREAVDYYNNPEEYVAQRRRDHAQMQAIYDGLQEFGAELREDPTIIMQLSSDLGETLGVHMATSFIEGFVRKSAYEKGRITGDIVGMIVFEILLEIILAVTTEGVGNLIRGIGAIGQGARASGRLASAIRRLMNASPAIRNLLRSLNVGEDVLDVARTTENVVDTAEDAVDAVTSVDNVIPFPADRVSTSPSPLPERGNAPVTNLDDFRQRRRATEIPEPANNNTHFPTAEDNVMPIPRQEELPIAVGESRPLVSARNTADPSTPVASSRNGDPPELVEVFNDPRLEPRPVLTSGGTRRQTPTRLTDDAAGEIGDLPVTTRQRAGVSLAESHHIASRYNRQLIDIFDDVGLSIEGRANRVLLEEHGQLRGFWQIVDDGGRIRYQMRGHHPGYHDWVFNNLQRARGTNLPLAESQRRVLSALDQMEDILQREPFILEYGPGIFANNPNLIEVVF